MSGPFRFQADSSRSPLDRRPQNPLPAQPVSFKTNVNRMKTKKWVEAKKNAYDGDDWGDYDEYDEYGASEPDPPSASAQYAAPQAQAYDQRFDQPGRSFTDPQRQRLPQLGRRNSFEAGEEQRAFSASTGQPPQGFPEQHAHQPHQPQQPPPAQYVHPALRQASGAQSDTSDTPEHRRDFSPSAMPPPLQTRMSPPPGDVSGSPSARFPLRKSSIGQAESPVATSPRDRAPSNPGKALPFIRPADIYKRFEEERERERASLDEQRPHVEAAPGQNTANAQQPVLPPVEEGISTFDTDLRSVVDNAFTRADDQRSVPPTPISKSNSSVSRSDTDSTSGISPIMSRVPSSGASAVKARNLASGEGGIPMIAEEASESGAPVVSRPTSAALLGGTHQIPRKASPGHSRNISSTSLPGSGLTTPNAAGSPARSPAIKPQAHFSEPETAELSSLAHLSHDMKVSSSTDATSREADIAQAMKTSPVAAHAGLSAAEKESQDAFLESHQASTSVAEAFPRSRSESPSKGRVQELAGKFGDVSQSRRGSTQSNASRTSLQSWEKSQDNSRPSSPTKASSPSRDGLPTRPPTEREASFRPKLPGQWESYATSAASPSKELSVENLPATNNNLTSPLQNVDLTPTTANHSFASAEPFKSDPNALSDQTRGGVLPRPLQLFREESSSTIPPTPPAKDTPESEDMPPPPPLKEKSPEPRSATASSVPPERPIMLPQLSTDEAADDQESDRLRKEIVASLSPQQTLTGSAPEQNSASLHAGSGPVNRDSSLYPSEYENYWADGDRTSSHDRDSQTRSNAGNSITANPLTQSPVDAPKAATMTRFAWEDGGSGPSSDRAPQTPTAPSKSINQAESEEKIPTPAVEKAAEEQGVSQFPDPYFGPTHGVAVVKPEPISDADLNVRSPPADLPSPSTNTTQPDVDRATSPAPGLHVVNSAINPEAVDLPPRLSREVSSMSDQLRPSQDTSTEESHDPSHDPSQAPVVNPAISAPIHGVQEPTESSPIATVSPTSDKPLGFKDILQIKSPAERISSYNKTRNYWAHADHGLGDWVSTALSTNPDLATQPYPQPRPTLNTSGTMRHRPTGSISLFGKHHGVGSAQGEPAGAPAVQTPVTPTSAPTFPGSGRSASHQMQVKGKDLLHTAGALSGKGLTGAKGLFAKGKSRFKSDKASDSEPSSSREASEEPSDIGSTASDFDTLGRLSLDTTESGKEEKKHRRRFSSPFRRSARSRSRPGSIVLPSIESTPRSTPGHSRPQSYHPPEAWGAGPRALSTTPPAGELQTPERLGVLPSPAKSAFSLFPPDGDVPPVPPIPEATDNCLSEHATHRLLQSVIRNSTPPAVELEMLEEGPAFPEPPASRTFRLENDAGVGHQELPNDESGVLEDDGIVESVEKDAPMEPAMEAGQDEGSYNALPSQVRHDDFASTGTGHQEAPNDDDWVQIGVPRSDSESDEGILPQAQGEPTLPTGTRQQNLRYNQPQDEELIFSDKHVENGQDSLLCHKSVSPEDAPARQDTDSAEDMEKPFADESDDDLPPQLHHDPIAVKGPRIILDGEADEAACPSLVVLSKSTRAASIDLEMSPPWSPVKPHRLNSHEPDGQPHLQQPSNAHPQRPALDVSPMLPPAKYISDVSDSSDDEQATPLASAMNATGEGRFAYETELIGGDLSPISSHAPSDEEKTPTKPDRHASGTVEANATPVVVTVVDRAQSPRDKAAGENALKSAPRPKPQQHQHQQQLSAYRVVRAVEYLHSQSSFESWEHESAAGLSQSDDSPRLVEHDKTELPPEPPAFDLSRDIVKAEEAEEASLTDTPALLSGPDSAQAVVPIESDTPQEGPQQSPALGHAGAHKRSESLLSKISSMVSPDDASLSPVSSYGPRSRPPSSAAGRQRQIPSAKTSPIPVQIDEEPTAPDHAVNTSIDNDDFDLYADHNGVVKDEQGRPLRVTTDQPPKPTPTSGAPKPMPLSAPMDEASGRYSDERPMSFVWGPRDANGRPQDEINRPGGGGQDQSPPRLPNTRVQRSSQLRIGPIMKQKAQNTGTPSNGRLLEQPSQGQLGSKNVSPLSSYRESDRSSPHNNVSPPPVASASPPPPDPTPSTIPEQPHPESPRTSNGQPSPPKSPDPRLIQDPRAMMEAQMQMRGWAPGQPLPQSPRMRPNIPAQTQMQGPQSPPSAPRNQYEYQQMMARQAMHAPELKSPPPSGIQHGKKDEKFSIPKFSSVFKGLGKSSSMSPQASQPPRQQTVQPVPHQVQQLQNRMQPPLSAVPEDARRSASLQSGVSDITPAQMAPPKERRTSAFGLSRPLSIGQESHNSQDSTRVQITGSRLDLTYPASPPPSQGIPPQQPPQHVLQNVPNLPRPEDYRASTSGVPETSGKKKRFSSLGSIFNRSAMSGPLLPTKQKMSKEEKKAQKAQKYSSAMPLQSVPQGQPWPPQQPADPRQYGAIQYGPPPVAKPFPGFQSVTLQPMQLQAMQQHAVSPISPQSVQLQSMSPMTPQSMHSHGMPQQYTQVPQGFQHPVQIPPPQFAPQLQQPLGAPEGSAYMDTRQIAQIMQAQRMQEQSRPSTHHSSQTAHPSIPTAPSLPHLAKRPPEEPVPPAFNEYFKPDLKMIKPLPPIQPQLEQHNPYFQHPPQPQPIPVVPQQPRNPRSVSAPMTVSTVDQTAYVSQRQVSSPLHEPQYDTPQIPAAYTQVSGAFVSPSLEQGPSRAEESADARSYSRQNSDPLMQPISPQVSAMATSPPNLRQNSSDSVVSPISDPFPGPVSGHSPPPTSRPQKQKMTSITEQVQSERPWNLDLPHGATEQEIVRARQRQYLEQQLTAQEQLHAERTGRSPSPRSGQSQQSASPPPPAPTQAHPPRRESGGFRELLPRSSPQPYPITDGPVAQRSQPQEQQLPGSPIAPAPVHPGQSPSPAGYPLPISPDPANIRSPVNPTASMMPPPPLPAKIPHTPMNASFPDSHMTRQLSQDAASDHTHDSLYDPPPPPTDYQHPAHRGRPEYDDLPPTDEPPPYSGPGVPNEGMDKDRPRPPDIVTDRGRLLEPRQRQASLGILQHPQPASMAASPQRSSADMGADILRRQLLEVDERERTDRQQQAEAREAEAKRVQAERERAKARARELERSVSGGGRVGSLRSAQGSMRNGTSGFESSRRAVYELPAEEDDEPVMRATSFPGQEWVPTWTED